LDISLGPIVQIGSRLFAKSLFPPSHSKFSQHRKALIRHYQLVSQFDPEEYPDGNAQ
jgi:hypothetical protein